ncbi:MAG: hypothetical protein IMZ52_10245 [Actinobacteria bacterium]|nr:hypothetical protein [Actinomycetota bacterium]
MIRIYYHCPNCKSKIDSQEIIMDLNGTWIMVFTAIGYGLGLLAGWNFV